MMRGGPPVCLADGADCCKLPPSSGMTRHSFGFGLFLVAFAGLMAFAGEARAWTPFGTVEHITRIEDVLLKTPAGDALYLGHKTSTVYFIGGVYVADDGYVLGLQ